MPPEAEQAPAAEGEAGGSRTSEAAATAVPPVALARGPVEDVSGGDFSISSFLLRRTLALGYCSAFLSLAAQADGLFGCDGVFPPKSAHWFGHLAGTVPPPVILVALALLGTAVAGVSLAALWPSEQHAVATFALLWCLFAGCMGLAPAVYPTVADRLLLQSGLVGLFLVSGGAGGGAFAAGAQGVGRSLAAWLLFRAVFTAAFEKATGPCDAWRELVSVKESYQLEVFPLPTVWLLWLAPHGLVKALTLLQLYTGLVLSPLVLAPQRSMAVAATTVQLCCVLVGSAVANRGYAAVCLAALAFSLLDDTWHAQVWSEQLLRSWGCIATEEEVPDSETEDAGSQEAEPAADVSAPAKSSDTKEAVNTGAAAADSTWFVALLCAGGYAACFAAVLQGGDGVLAFLAADKGGALVLTAVALSASAVVFAGLTETVRRAVLLSSAAAALGVVGCALWTAGLLQLGRDLGMLTLPAAAQRAVSLLESANFMHSLSAGALPCPHLGGRADLVLQGAIDPTLLGRAGAGLVWTDLSSRFLPATDDRRPQWLQPYTPQLDRELWRFAQPASSKFPRWVMRLIRGLHLRQGGAARLSAGAWNGVSATLHGTGSGDYAKIAPPLVAVRAIWRRRSMVADMHSNKWWNTTDVKVLKQFETEELEKSAKRLKPQCAVTPAVLAEAPIAEAALTLVVATLLWKLLVHGAAR